MALLLGTAGGTATVTAVGTAVGTAGASSMNTSQSIVDMVKLDSAACPPPTQKCAEAVALQCSCCRIVIDCVAESRMTSSSSVVKDYV